MANKKMTVVVNNVPMDLLQKDIFEVKLAISAVGASKCDVCTEVANWIIASACAGGSCAAAEAAIGGLFTVAEAVFFPEGEEVLVPLEAVVETIFGALCAKYGFDWIKRNTKDAARQCCEAAKLC